MKIRTSNDTVKPLVLLLFILAGAIIGSIGCVAAPEYGLWENVIFRQGIGTDSAAYPFGFLLLRAAGIPILWMLFAMFTGFSLAGAPFACALLLFRGMALGTVLAQLYFAQGVTGCLTALLFVMPYTLAGIFLYATGMRESLRLSYGIFRFVCLGRGEKPVLRLYLIRYAVLLLFLCIIGLLQCLLLRFGYPVYLEIMTGK